MKVLSFIILVVLVMTSLYAADDNKIRIFTWEGYVQQDEITMVNKILNKKGYQYQVELIDVWAEGPDQMFNVIRAQKPDISFLTLNYIKMQDSRTAKLLQPININSPRLSNYKHLSTKLTNIPMGVENGKPLYVPWGGGAYGIWADMDKISENELPRSVKDLFDSKWKGKISLTLGQIQPNIAISLLALGKSPFYINDVIGDRSLLSKASNEKGEYQTKLNSLYSQVGYFWTNYPEFKDNLLLVASYGPGAFSENSSGGNWKLVIFNEGNTVWLDTINFHRDLSGKKLEAAEIFLDYFIGKEVQDRVVNGLGMVAASSLVDKNTLIEENPNFFDEDYFWPPYSIQADNIMNTMSSKALESNK